MTIMNSNNELPPFTKKRRLNNPTGDGRSNKGGDSETSLLKFLHKKTWQKTQIHKQLSPSISSIPISLPSPPLRTVIQGPSKSGKSSIAMDFALNIASSPPSQKCLQCGLRYFPPEENNMNDDTTPSMTNSSDDDGGGDTNVNGFTNGGKVCTCCAVFFLIPECRKSELHFPLRCFPIDGQDLILKNEEELQQGKNPSSSSELEQQELRFKQEMRRLDLEEENSNNPLYSQQHQRQDYHHQSKRHYWNKQEILLNRIKIRYIKNSQDLITFLAKLQSLPPQFRPWGGLIIDDLDCFLCENNEKKPIEAETVIVDDDANDEDQGYQSPLKNEHDNNNCASIQECMKFIQLLAQIADTSDFLHQKEVNIETIACVNSERFRSSASFINNMMQNYMPAILTIEEADNKPNILNDNDGFQYLSSPLASWRSNLEYSLWKYSIISKNGSAITKSLIGTASWHLTLAPESEQEEDDTSEFMKEIVWKVT